MPDHSTTFRIIPNLASNFQIFPKHAQTHPKLPKPTKKLPFKPSTADLATSFQTCPGLPIVKFSKFWWEFYRVLAVAPARGPGVWFQGLVLQREGGSDSQSNLHCFRIYTF